MKGSNATWMMISIELYWDNEITDTSTNSKWKRPLSAGEMMAVVLQLCDAGGGDQCMLEVVIRACLSSPDQS